MPFVLRCVIFFGIFCQKFGSMGSNQLPCDYLVRLSWGGLLKLSCVNKVKIKVHAKNQLPRLSGFAGCGGWVPLNYVVSPTSYWVEVGL